MQMMHGNTNMMGVMMQGNGMNMMNDSTISMNMMHSMMKNGKLMNHMVQMMHSQGMMSEDCMNSSIMMMGNKGMDMGNMHAN